MVRNPPGHDREASPDLAVSTIDCNTLSRRRIQGRKNEFEYPTEYVGIYDPLLFVGLRGLCELGRNGQ